MDYSIIGLNKQIEKEYNNIERSEQASRASQDAVVRANEASLNNQRVQNLNLANNSLESRNNNLESRINSLESEITEEFKKRKALEEENKIYKDLLCKPMAEIAEKNGNFKETYIKQQAAFSEWIVSQRSFKELSMKYGRDVGKTPEQVIAEATLLQEDVINDTTEFGNGVSQQEIDNLAAAEQLKIEEAEKKIELEKIMRTFDENLKKMGYLK
jgi:hypothetical protein